MDDDRAGGWERWASLAGLVSAILLVTSLAIQGVLPTPEQSPETVAAFFSDSSDRTMTAVFLRLFAGFAFLWFVGALYSALTRAERGTARLSHVALLAGGLVIAMSGGANAPLAAMAHQAGDGTLLPAVAAPLLLVTYMFYVMSGMALGWLLLAAALVTWRTGVFARWTAWLAIAAGVINVFLPVVLWGESIAFVGHLVALVWVSAVSIAMFRHHEVVVDSAPSA